jgi:hypothetical protein
MLPEEYSPPDLRREAGWHAAARERAATARAEAERVLFDAAIPDAMLGGAVWEHACHLSALPRQRHPLSPWS